MSDDFQAASPLLSRVSTESESELNMSDGVELSSFNTWHLSPNNGAIEPIPPVSFILVLCFISHIVAKL